MLIKSVCYFCGGMKTSKEHVPPKLFFKGFLCDSITVPACNTHNSKKSGDDQAMVSALMSSLNNLISENEISLSADVIQAIEIAKSSFKYTKRRVKNKTIVDTFSETAIDFPMIAHLTGDIDSWIVQLTAALVFDGLKFYDKSIDWEKAIARSTDWLPSNSSEPLTFAQILELLNVSKKVHNMAKNLMWVKGWSAHPKPYPETIYQFYFLFGPESDDVIVKHIFYESYVWYVLFSASSQTIDGLKQRTTNYN